MLDKKGQRGSSAATLVGIITLVIVFYILFLPPQDRNQLLEGDGSTSGTGGGTQSTLIQKETIFSKGIGRIEAYKEVQDKTIPNMYITQTTNSKILAEIAPVSVRNGFMDHKSRNVSFGIDEDIENLNNIFMSMTALKRSGALTIKLNGAVIFDYALTNANPEPIQINKNLLERRNVLEFSVSGVGMRFWNTNEYSIEDIKIYGDVTDTSNQQSRAIFTLTEAEYANIEKATLKFIPYCGGMRNTGTLYAIVNEKVLFSAVPICGDPYYVPLPIRQLSAGENEIRFSTSEGGYSIEQINIDMQSKPIQSIVYYFEMDKRLFTGYAEVVSEAECGKADGYCPSNCDEDRDKDCCFAESKDNYWCDEDTNDADDRCASAIDSAKCSRCTAGYENYKGEAPEICEGLCGDDKDNKCPTGCSKFYDKDCCFEDNEDNYWCDDLPITGLNSVCESSLSSGECEDCPYGYKKESGEKAECKSGYNPIKVEEEDVLKEDYQSTLSIEFVDDGMLKKADININGHMTSINQEKAFYSKDISLWLRPDNNYIEIFPLTTLNIVKMEVTLE